MARPTRRCMPAVTLALSCGDLRKAPARPCRRRWSAPPSTRMEDCPMSSMSDRGYHGTNADASACSTARLTSGSELTTAGEPHRCDVNTFPYRSRRLSTKDSGRGEYAARMNAGVSPRSGHPSEPAGTRAADPAAPLAVPRRGLIIPDDDHRRGMKCRAMTAAASSAAVTEPTTDAGGQGPTPGHIACQMVVVVPIVDRRY
uniref:Uncharacterized protein n=1 Tax=Setaria italica TaxID=4555 RepID=K3Z9S5_SETIT